MLKMNEYDQSVKTERGTFSLTPKEWDILSLLKERSGEVLSAEEIYETVWDAVPYNCSGVIAVHLRHIREKIEKDPSHPRMIRSFWGKGYRFSMD